MTKIRSAGACALACLVLAACGGGGGGGGAAEPGGPTPTSVDYFPVPSQARWVYVDDTGSTERVDVVGTAATAQGQGVSLVTTDASGTLLDSTIAYVDSHGVTIYPPPDVTGFEHDVGPLKMLAFPAVAGQSFTQVDTTVAAGDVDGDGKPDTLALKSVVTVVGLEAIDVPAAHVPAALHVRTDSMETIKPTGGGATLKFRSVVDDWYAPDIGLVRSTEVDYSDGTTAGAPSTRSLSAYRVGSARSESAPPTVASTAPGAVARASGADVSVTFSEPVDADTLAAGWRIVDSAGNVVDGHVTMVGTTAHFVPDTAWAGGTYSASLSTGVTDLIGNPLAQASTWTFTLDATGPVLLSATPADGTSELALDVPIVLNFSEPVSPASVNASTVWASGGGTPIELAFAVSVDGASVTLTPVTAWPARKTLSLSLQNVTDAVGNPMTDGVNLSFQTDSGAFAYPQSLVSDAAAYGSVIIDLDGDGHADFVYTSQTADGRIAPFVRYGRADGSLEAPVQLLAGDGDTCVQTDQLRIVDLDGNGLRDVAVGATWCPWRVLRQTAPRQFAAGESFNYILENGAAMADLDGDGVPEFVGVLDSGGRLAVWSQDGTRHFGATPVVTTLPSFGGGSLHVADMDGDGIPELVFAGGGNFDSGLSVWKRQADGSYAQRTQMDTGLHYIQDIAIGDVNGDGRPDIVAAIGDYPEQICVLLQQPDGSFAPCVYQATYSWPSAVRLADIDGDGRLDVVVEYSGWGTFGVFSQRADGTLAPEADYAAPYGSSMASFAIGDLNGDGRADVVLDGMLMQQRTPGSGVAAPLAAPGLAHAQRVPHLGHALRLRALSAHRPGAAS